MEIPKWFGKNPPIEFPPTKNRRQTITTRKGTKEKIVFFLFSEFDPIEKEIL